MSFPVLQWLLIELGLIYLFTESFLFGPIRVALAKRSSIMLALLYCRACTGFWLGAATAVWFWPESWAWYVPFKAGIATLALGAIWSTFHPNTAFASERSYLEFDDAE